MNSAWPLHTKMIEDGLPYIYVGGVIQNSSPHLPALQSLGACVLYHVDDGRMLTLADGTALVK